MANEPHLTTDGYLVLVDTDTARITEITVAPGQHVSAHAHSQAQELCYCISGVVTVEIQGRPQNALPPGACCSIPAAVPHRLLNSGPAPCKFLLVHRGGAFDFIPSNL
jgi:quercetin dioxygenase-like cupin family protein